MTIDVRDFKDPRILGLTEDWLKELTVTDDVKWSYRLLLDIRQAIKSDLSLRQNISLLERYHQIMVTLSWLALPLLSWREVLDLFTRNFVAVFDLEPEITLEDVFQKIKTRLVALSVYEERDEYKNKIRQALLQNQERLTAEKIITVGGQSVEPTVGNWLGWYSSSLGAGQVDKLKYREWLTTDHNFNSLPIEEKQKLESLFKLYERWKFSSRSREGMEDTVVTSDDQGKTLVFKNGVLEPVVLPAEVEKRLKVILTDPEELNSYQKALSGLVRSTVSSESVAAPKAVAAQAPADQAAVEVSAVKPLPAAPAISQQEIWRRYQGNEAENQKVAAGVQGLRVSAGDNLTKLFDGLYFLLQGKNPEPTEVLAYLSLLAEREKLDDVLKEDQRFFKMLEQRLLASRQSQLLNDFRFYPTAPQFIQQWLAMVLQEKLGLSENEAARWGLRLGNILKKAGNDKYAQIAYFDLKSEEFRWRK